MKEYTATIIRKEVHYIKVKDDIEINEATIFGHISPDTIVEDYYTYASDIQEWEND